MDFNNTDNRAEPLNAKIAMNVVEYNFIAGVKEGDSHDGWMDWDAATPSANNAR